MSPKLLRKFVVHWGAITVGVALAAGGLQPALAQAPGGNPAAASSPVTGVFSNFKPYQPLPKWSGWCDGDARCAEPLAQAFRDQTPASRPLVRAHGWHLWAAIWTPAAIDKFTNDAAKQVTNVGGTTGCWLNDAASCSGYYPIWMTWPNTGNRIAPASGTLKAKSAAKSGAAQVKPLGAVTPGSAGATAANGDPDPSQVETVNTIGDTPVYNLPPLVLVKRCGISLENATAWLKDKQWTAIGNACDRAGQEGMFCAGQICDGTAFVNEGNVMIATESLELSNYENIIRTLDAAELTKRYTEWREPNPQPPTISRDIDSRYIATKHMFWPVKGCRPGAAEGSPGCRVRYGALPPWIPGFFKDKSYATNAEYLGYERWKQVVAIDTCLPIGTASCASADSATLQLAHVSSTGNRAFPPITTQKPSAYPATDFQHIQISKEVLDQYFTPADRALLDQAMIWAYGDKSNGFEPGDFLVSVAMHVTTKEIDSWAFQSVWWSPRTDTLGDCAVTLYNNCFGQSPTYGATLGPDSDTPTSTSGLQPRDILAIDDGTKNKNWRKYYLLTDEYGIRYQIDGQPSKIGDYFAGTPPKWAQTDPAGRALPYLPVSQNVYIEPVIHPIGTNCRNCHSRAGFTPVKSASGVSAKETPPYNAGAGRTGGQTAQCPSLLGDYGDPITNLCMWNPRIWFSDDRNHCERGVDGIECRNIVSNNAKPVVGGDYIWFIPDTHFEPLSASK